MSTVYLATDPEQLAERLGEELHCGKDFFQPVSIVVANRFIGKWLRLWLARKLGVAINLRFLRLEQAIWEMLRAIDPRRHSAPLDLLDHDSYRLMVLSVLLGEKTADLASLHDYMHGGTLNQRASGRRLWHLADRLAGLIRDYEYHRQEDIIQHWIRGDLVFDGTSVAAYEQSQRAIFRDIIREPDGKRALLGQAAGKLFKTLPQYAQELMLDVPASSWIDAPIEKQTYHLFGITHISGLHWTTLRWLGDKANLAIYYLNPLVAAAESSREYSAATPVGESELQTDRSLISLFAQAGAESLQFLASMQAGPHWHFAHLPARERDCNTVLHCVQQHLLGELTECSPRLPQDRSLQIVACPGIYREVETVYNSIVHNLLTDPELQQTDIAVLVTDMERYRPAVQAVFDREPRRLLYNLTDFTAAGLSVFGQALIEMLDLALESFTRSRVFSVLLNPCFLARLKVDRTEALNWLTWAETLGIYHGWDSHDKKERGYVGSPFFGWQLGMRRLRLGRIMDTTADEGAAPRFRDMIPYADLASSDKEHLDAFCRAVEGLLPVLTRLRKFHGTGRQWAAEIERLAGNFLDIPPDRPEESQVRNRLVQALNSLSLLDQMSSGRETDKPTTYPLPLIREFLLDALEHLEGTRGEYLTGGVTISALHPFRQAPFRIIYVMGLGEELFPGSNALATFDLRAQHRLPGDIRPAEFNRYLFMETLLAARDKIYLLYNCRELQRDQELHASVPLVQLRRWLEEHVIANPFVVAQTPLSGSSITYLQSASETPHDVNVNYCTADRTLAALEAQQQNLLQEHHLAELKRRLDQAQRTFTADRDSASAEPDALVPTITISELERFLVCPAEAAVRRHLQLRDESERDENDDEPFLCDWRTTFDLKRQVLERFVARAATAGVDMALADWQDRFGRMYEEWQLRCQVPESPFGDVDQSALRAELEVRIQGSDGLADFVRRRESFECCGPILIGESLTPTGARTRFPALTLPLNHGVPLMLPQQARLVGTSALAWRSRKTFELLVITQSDKVKEDELARPMLEPLLFYLALKSGEESGDWLGKRAFHLHVAQPEGIITIEYQPGDISVAAATMYLRELVADFLDAGAFDLLPFTLLMQKELNPTIFLPDNEAAALADDFSQRLQDALEEDAESEYPAYRRMRLLEIVEAQVPGDAFAKVRRRFCLLDRGPARKRKQPAKEEDRARKPRKARRS